MAEPAPAGAGTQAPALDELMMAMDVVDTLRHEERMLERELGQDDRDAALKARLRELYESQGLAVSDRLIEDGIAALRESRFAYAPPAPGWRVSLARAWVGRWRWGPWAGAGAGVLVLLIGWSIWSGGADARLADRLAQAAAEARPLAQTAEAQAALAAVLGRGEAALAAGESGAAGAALAELEALRAELALAYEIRIVARPGEPSGVWRVPDVNSAARNTYLIVEAVAPDGSVLTRPVTSEETGRTARVSRWGLRVPQRVFDAVAADKRDDGILQDAVLGVKRPGALAPDWTREVSGGAITEWDE